MSVTFSLAKDQTWAKAGHVLAWYQTQLSNHAATELPRSLPSPLSSHLTFGKFPRVYYFGSSSTKVTFDDVRGQMSSLEYNKRPILINSRVKSYNPAAPSPVFALDFWRPQTDNDVAWQTGQWKRYGLHMMTSRLLKMDVDVTDPSGSTAKPSLVRRTEHGTTMVGELKVTIRVEQALAPPSLDWHFHVVTTYTFSAPSESATNPDFSMKIHTRLTPKGSFPANLPRIGYNVQLGPEFTNVKWFGRGPLESYNDKRLSQRFGVWDRSIDDMEQHYDVPQENGNRCDVYWCSVSGSSAPSTDGNPTTTGTRTPTLRASYVPEESPASVSSGATTTDRAGMQFSTQIYDPAVIDDAKHPCDLPAQRRSGALWRIDTDVAGVGTGACGPGTEEKDQVACREREWTFVLDVF